MPSPPSPFDDEPVRQGAAVRAERDDARRPEGDHRVDRTDADSDDDHEASKDGSDRPNYLIRRAVVVGAGLAVVVAGGYVVAQVVDGNNGQTSSGASAEWNTLVLVDERTGEVTLIDPDGEEIDRIATGLPSVGDSAAVGATLVVDAGSDLALIDLSKPESAVETITFDDDRTPGIFHPAGTDATLVSGTPQRAVLVNGADGDVIDTDDFTDVTGVQYVLADALSDPSGQHVLVADAGNFQSVLLSFDRSEPSYFPGVPIAVGPDVVVTAQNVGTRATINVFDHDGEQISTATTDPVRAGMIGGGAIVVTTVDGQVMTIDTGSGTAESSDSIGDDVVVDAGTVSVDGDRLAVVSDAGVSIVDDTGAVLATIAGAVANSIESQPSPNGSTCLVLHRPATGELVIVAWADGSVVAEARGTPTALATADGCTVVEPTQTPPISLSATGAVDLDLTGEPVAISPDGERLVVADGRRLSLADAAGSAGIDVGPTGRSPRFVQR